MLTKSQWQKRMQEIKSENPYYHMKSTDVIRFLDMINDPRAKIVKEGNTTYVRYLDKIHRNNRTHNIKINKEERAVIYEGKSSVQYEVVGPDSYYEVIIDSLESKIGY